MKISIVTVYNSENSGSYWQAYALKNTLEKLGHQVTFYKRSTIGSSHSLLLLLVRSMKYLLKNETRTVRNLWSQHFAFSRMQKSFKESRSAADAYVIGSDTLWSIDQPVFKKKFDLYSGKKFPSNSAMTYAVSVGNATEGMFAEIKDIHKRLDALVGISGRDNSTVSIAKKYTSNQVYRVIDPTLLLDCNEYINIAKTKEGERKLLVYTFQDLSKYEWEVIKRFAETKKTEVLVYGRNSKDQKGCAANPESFISAFANASYVVTDTFHGTIFSMLFHRQFVCLNHNKVKVKELVHQFEFQNRLTDNAEQLLSALNTPISFERFEEIRREEKYKAIDYLDSTLHKISQI